MEVSSASSFGLDLLFGRLFAVGSASEGERDRLRVCSSGMVYDVMKVGGGVWPGVR